MVTLRSLIGIFVSIGLLVALALSPAFAQPVFDPPGLERAIEAQERHTDDLLGIQGVVGTAVGLGTNGKAVVKIYTEKSGVAGLPRSLNGVPVVVQVTGKIFAFNKPDANGDHNHGGDGEEVDPPVTNPIGVSSGTERLINVNGDLYCTVGTLGARVTDGINVFALSNAHVYALVGSDPDGDVQVRDVQAVVDGDRILQPGRVDMTARACGSDAEINAAEIGNLAAFVPIVFSTSASNTVDAAIASTTKALVGNSTPADGYGTPKSATSSAEINQKVMKYGRTTGQTNGKVDAINATVNIGYDSGVARFVNQIVIRPGNFSAGGDSGSLVVVRGGADNRKPVGLLFAGSIVVTIVNPISDVLSELGTELDATLTIDDTP